MRRKLAAVVGGVAAGLLVATPFALADDVDGGHCEYGDFSVNVEPSCDTSESDGPETAQLTENLRDLEDVLQTIPRNLDQLGPSN